jgi:membrane associated rhomboid family serine protease
MSGGDYGLGASVLLAATALVSLLGLFAAPALIRAAAFRPYALVRKAQYWRLLSSGFVHANFSHLLFNLLTFYFFAFTLERRIGTVAFVALYGLGLLIGNLSTYVRHRNEPDYVTVGASGAVSAVLFASIVYFPTMRLYIFPLPVPIPALLFAVLYLGYSYYQSRQAGDQVNHDAHIGGALTGLGFVAVAEPSAYERLIGVIQAMSSSG